MLDLPISLPASLTTQVVQLPTEVHVNKLLTGIAIIDIIWLSGLVLESKNTLGSILT